MASHSLSGGYATEPPTDGKVVLKTSIGDLDVELWPKEAPTAVRNFVQLCMEGYYTNTVFHRVIKDFMAQGGDPTGTGKGGESIYGGPFKDEFHSRLKFKRRGLVAMANDGKDRNMSQFFITLGACEWLNKKHTIFGKVTGNTLYNILKFNDLLTDKEDRPRTLVTIQGADILSNPFKDIKPRKKEAAPEKQKKKKKKKTVKNTALLSFGDEEEYVPVAKKVKPRHEVEADLYAEEDEEPLRKKKKVVEIIRTKKQGESAAEFDRRMREMALSQSKTYNQKKAKEAGENLSVMEKSRMEYEEIKQQLLRQRGAKRKREEVEEEPEASELDKLKANYLQKRLPKKARQQMTAEKVGEFEAALKEARAAAPPQPTKQWTGITIPDGEEEESSSDEFDPSWFNSQLKFPKRLQDQKKFNIDDIEVIDTRKHPNRNRKRLENPRDRNRRRQKHPLDRNNGRLDNPRDSKRR